MKRSLYIVILVIDNYDSFTFNLVQYLHQIGEETTVIRNDHLSLKDIEKMAPDHILLSPGPGNPNNAGICLDIVHSFYDKIPILGVCLGQQIIAQAFGGSIKKALHPMHGKVSYITHDQKSMFQNLPSPLPVTRYHSLVVDHSNLPECLDISAQTDKGEVMAIRHKEYQVEGVQFHPEAILTNNGLHMLKNFFHICYPLDN